MLLYGIGVGNRNCNNNNNNNCNRNVQAGGYEDAVLNIFPRRT